MHRISLVGTTFAALALVGLPGCRPPHPAVPPTFKAGGRVVQKDGKPYMGKGAIEFRSATNPQHSTNGEIADDGSFVLRTIAGNRAVEGAQEGEHTVTVMIPQDGGKRVRSVQLKARYTVKGGESNDLLVKLEQ